MGWVIFALGWGLAEATLFFIVPDVYLTFLALQSGKKAFKACWWALAGALLGGTIMYMWGTLQPQVSLQMVERVPAINEEMIAEVDRNMQTKGLWAMILGPAQGIPYKIYAVMAAQQNIPFLLFLLASLPARVIRFLLTTALAWIISKYLFTRLSIKTKYWILTCFWLVFYTGYFLMNPS